MKKILLIAAFAVSIPLFAQAETLQFPSEEPIAEVSIPHSWGPKETETGVDATSPDSAIYFSIDIADDDTMKKTIDDAVDFLAKNGVEIDEKTKEEFPDRTLNGMKLGQIEWSGTDKDGPVHIHLAFAIPSEHKMLVITYWGSQEDEGKHEDAVDGIISSLKPITD